MTQKALPFAPLALLFLPVHQERPVRGPGNLARQAKVLSQDGDAVQLRS